MIIQTINNAVIHDRQNVLEKKQKQQNSQRFFNATAPDDLYYK